MRCDKARHLLQQSPAHVWRSPALLAHLMTCADCRGSRSKIIRLYTTARTLPRPTLSPERDTQILALLRTASGEPTRERKMTMTRWAFTGTATAAAIIIGMTMGPRLVPTPVSAASVRDAVQATHTWHFTGWRIQDNKKIPWEIWGRRTPFLYQERIGDEIVMDNGQQRIHVIPPDKSAYRMQGLNLILPSQPLTTEQEQPLDTHAAFLAGTGEEYLKSFMVDKTRGNTVTLVTGRTEVGAVEEIGRLTVDSNTRLPMAYELQRSQYKEYGFGEKPPKEREAMKLRQWTQASLKAEYNVALPPNLTRVSLPKNYTTVDYRKAPNIEANPNIGILRQNGFTVTSEVLAHDAEGNLRLRLRTWLGDTLLDQGSALGVSIIPICPPFTQRWEANYPTDERGRPYMPLNQPDSDCTVNQSGLKLLYFAPIQPLASVDPRPQVMTLPVEIRAEIYMPIEGGGVRQRTVLAERVTLTVPLPEPVSDLGYDKPRGHPQGLNWGKTIQHSLLWETSVGRTNYWNNLARPPFSAPGTPQTREYLKKAGYWLDIVEKEAERLGDKEWAENARKWKANIDKQLRGQP